MIARAFLFSLITFGITMVIGVLVATIIKIIAMIIRRAEKKTAAAKPEPT